MENSTSAAEAVRSLLAASPCDGILFSVTSTSHSRVAKYYDSVWGQAASVYRQRSTFHLQTKLAATLRSKAAAIKKVQSAIREVWDLGESGWESSDEESSSTALDEKSESFSDADSLWSQSLLSPAQTGSFDGQECTRNGHASLKDDVLLSEEGTQQASGDNREDSRTESDDESSSESTMLVTLKRNALEVGGLPFGVALLGGVRDSSGQLQTIVTSVDEEHNHEDGFGIEEGDVVSSWNDTQLTGMSFEEVCSLQTEAYGQGLCGKETEARVEVTRCNETKQNYKTIKCMWETELAKARDSLMTPSLSKLKKEWIEQPGSIQVSVKYDCVSSSLTLGVVQARLRPLLLPSDQSKPSAPKILVNARIIPAPSSSESHRTAKLVQATPTGDVMWNQTFPPHELQLHQLMETDLQVLVWEYTHETDYTFLGEVNVLLSDTTLVDLRGHPVWYPLGEHNPNLGALPPPKLGKQKRGAILNKLQAHLKQVARRHPSDVVLDTPVNSSAKSTVQHRDAGSPSGETAVQPHRRKNHRSVSFPCILEEQIGTQDASPTCAITQDSPHHLSVSYDRVGGMWDSFLDQCDTLEGEDLQTTGSSLNQPGSFQRVASDCFSELDSVFVDSEDEIIFAADSPYSPAPLGEDRFYLEVPQRTSPLPHRYRRIASMSSPVDDSVDEGEQPFPKHRSQSLSDLTEDGVVIALKVPSPRRRKRSGNMLTRMLRRLSSRPEEAIDSLEPESRTLCQLGPAQFVPEGCKAKPLNVVGKVELLLQLVETTILKITFIQLTKSNQWPYHGDCLTHIVTYDEATWVSKRQVTLHFQPKSTNATAVFIGTKPDSTLVQLNMRCSCGRLSKLIIGDVWLNMAELAAHSSDSREVTGWFPLHRS